MSVQPLLAFALPGLTALVLWLWSPGYKQARAAALAMSLVLVPGRACRRVLGMHR